MRMQGDREPQGPQGGGLGSRGLRQPGEEGASCWGQQEDGRREGAAHGHPAGLHSCSQRQGHTPSQRVPQSLSALLSLPHQTLRDMVEAETQKSLVA